MTGAVRPSRPAPPFAGEPHGSPPSTPSFEVAA